MSKHKRQRNNSSYQPRVKLPDEPTKEQKELVYRHKVDLSMMRGICLAGIDDFDPFGQRVDTRDGSYVFIDRGAKILGVAHRDSVASKRHFNYDPRYERVYTPTLDDRLGVFILMDLLAKMLPEDSYDILLTEGEESGRSTAKHFTLPEGKEYNWMFQFDRGGVDVVHYQYTDPPWMEALKKFGVKIEGGMFSDICYLEHLAICGVNIGTAYYRYHSDAAYCNLVEVVEMVDRFHSFYQEFKDQKFSHDEKEYDKRGKKIKYSYPSYQSYQSGYQKPSMGGYLMGWEDPDGSPYGERMEEYLTSQGYLGWEERTFGKRPTGHFISCGCFACVSYWKKRLEYNTEYVAQKKQIEHYHDLCVCVKCKAKRGEATAIESTDTAIAKVAKVLCKHDIEFALCFECNPNRDIRKGKGGARVDGNGSSPKRFQATKQGVKLIKRRDLRRERGRETNQILEEGNGAGGSDPVRGIPVIRSRDAVSCNSCLLECYWCRALVSKLATTSGGDLICQNCADYAESGQMDASSCYLM